MRNRSRIHMLRVLAMRFQDCAPADLVKTLRTFARELEARQADGRTHSAAEEKRIERQRTLFNMLPSSHATERLKEAMMQRAYDLIWDGDGQACDALLEFLPSRDAEAILTAWESDQDDNEPKSKWH
jgi:hypothetical protein